MMKSVDASFWRDRRVFVTGHTGFKGGWLALWLQQMGAQVHGYALAPDTTPNLFEQARVAEGMDSQFADIRDLPALQAALKRAAPEIVIHMAAQPLVRRAYRQPVETYATNVMGTVHLLEAVRHSPGVRAVLIVTSDKCYDNREWVWPYRETDPLGGFDPYSSSKGCAELVTAAWRNAFFPADAYDQHGVAIASARAGNVIGGGDWAEDRLIPDVLRAFEAGQPVVIRNPEAVRPWQHVLEPLSGYLMLAQSLVDSGAAFCGGWNFGPREGDSHTVASVVERFAQALGAHWQCDTREQPHEAHQLRLDSSKARALLGWQPRWTLDATLQRIHEWHAAHRVGADMHRATLQQIDAYLNTAALI
jgi:CDP-glucose 4,6-dehydratase